MSAGGWPYRALKWRALGWLTLGRRTSAREAFDEILRRWPNDAHALASRSHLRAQLGDRDGAIADARALVALNPQRSAADWFNLAYLLDEAGRLDEAEPAFRRAG